MPQQVVLQFAKRTQRKIIIKEDDYNILFPGSDSFVVAFSPNASQRIVGVVCKCPPAGFSHRCPKGPSQGRREETLWPESKAPAQLH